MRPLPHPLEESPSKLVMLTNRFHQPFVATMYHIKLATTPSKLNISFAHLQLIRQNIASHSADDRCWAADQWAPIRSQWNHDLEAACRCRCQFNTHQINVAVMLACQIGINQWNLFFGHYKKTRVHRLRLQQLLLRKFAESTNSFVWLHSPGSFFKSSIHFTQSSKK